MLMRLPHPGWSVVEEGVDAGRVRFWEAAFTLGNGYLGSRGVLEEGHPRMYAGTYLAGVYDRGEGESFEIVNFPNPIPLQVYVGGQKLDLERMEVLEHRRVLDLRRGLLLRRTLFRDGEGFRYEYESLRFFSMAEPRVGVIRASLSSLDIDAEVVVRSVIDGTTKNEMRATGRPIKHYSVVESGEGEMEFLGVKTNDLKISVGFGSKLSVRSGGKHVEGSLTRSYSGKDGTVREVSFMARRGRKYLMEKLIGILRSSNQSMAELRRACEDFLREKSEHGLGSLLRNHTRAWSRLWRVADVEIEGDEEIQRALRFNIYHLLIAAPRPGMDASIPAKALSGEWYQGHVFWDTEIFALPFFIYVRPEVARELLLYRYRRLEKARQGARRQGYSGALWPWESALTGEDETPDQWVNFDGTVIPVYNKEREHHIAGDVIYGLANYCETTGDEAFMLDYGAEMVFETARFWASRVTYDGGKKKYVIRKVVGPNEFQECVDNNSYTNALARWALRYASALYRDLRNRYPRKLGRVMRRIGLEEHEVERWEEIAENILILEHPGGLIEEFEGYFQRRDVVVERDDRGMPSWPPGVKMSEVANTQLVKQADVLLLLSIFPDEFPPDVKRVNFEYYERRTTHKSSLSLPSHAVVALEVGEVDMAYKYFKTVANTDLQDIHGNTELGVHVAALGGSWQVLVHGFAGLRPKGGTLRVNPILPAHWGKVRLRVWFRRSLLEFVIARDGIEVSSLGGAREANLEIWGKRYVVRVGGKIHVTRG